MRSGKMTKKKKKKKTLTDHFIQDAGAGMENFDAPPNIVNVFDRARKIKTWKEFIYYAEQENLQPSDALLFCYKAIKRSWNKYKIFNDPDQVGAIVMLLDAEKKLTRKRLYVSEELKQFCAWTGYKVKSYDKFENDMAAFRDLFGIKRNHDGSYSRKQIAENAARALRKKFKGKR